MANQVRIRTSIEVVNDNSVSGEEGQNYTHKALDGNADSRMWGGSYEVATYDSDAVAYWKNVIVAQTASTAYFNVNTWNKEDEAPVGTKPVTTQAIAVEYVKTKGAEGTVSLLITSNYMAVLDVGESIVIPCMHGPALNSLSIIAQNYSAGVNEATVNIMIVGQNA